MIKYINTKTQAVIKTACELKGGDWLKVEKDQLKKADTTVSKTRRKKCGE